MAESTFFVGNYICTEELGRGQYGTVYKGRHKLTHEVVAIKKINVELLSQQQSRMLEFLSREIDVMKKCEHKNIVGLRETIKRGHNIFMILEYCDGGDFFQLLKRRKCLSEDETRFYMQQLAHALKHLLEKSIVHRDLKPQNLLLCSVPGLRNEEGHRRYCLKIADFGFARLVEAFSESQMIETWCGSPLYMAPEILMGKPYSVKADLWSLGVIAYETVMGKVPFPAKTLPALQEMYRNSHKYDPFKNIGTKLSGDCIDLLKSMLKIDQDQRISWPELFMHPWLKFHENHFDFGSKISSFRRSKRASVKTRRVAVMVAVEDDVSNKDRMSKETEQELPANPVADTDEFVVIQSMPDVAAPMKQVFPKIEENNQTAIPKFLTLFGLSAELSSDEARFIAQRQKTPLRLSPSVSIVQDMIQRVVAVLNAAQSMVESNEAEAYSLYCKGLELLRDSWAIIESETEQTSCPLLAIVGDRLRLLFRDSCEAARKLHCDVLLPSENLIYSQALQQGRLAAFEEFYGEYERSASLYSIAIVLLRQVLEDCRLEDERNLVSEIMKKFRTRRDAIAPNAPAS